MSIYTRTGDEGNSRQIDGQFVPKNHPRMEAVGTIDELDAQLGVCVRLAFDAREGKRAHKTRYGNLARSMQQIQRQLFAVGAHLAAAGTNVPIDTGETLTDRTVTQMEQFIDENWKELPTLEGFVLPGGTMLACQLHVARTICRRAERALASMAQAGVEVPSVVRVYVNRLSDLLFLLARMANAEAGQDENPAHGD